LLHHPHLLEICRLLLLLLECCSLSTVHLHNRRSLGHCALGATLAHSWSLAHLTVEWCCLNVGRRMRHPRGSSMALLTPVLLHWYVVRMTSRSSHWMSLLYNRAWTRRTSTHTGCRLLHWHSHTVNRWGRM
jgi:hypothetical protein